MKIRDIGEISYSELDPDIQTDVANRIGFKRGEITEEEIIGGEEPDSLIDIKIMLENGPSVLPLVAVNPKQLLDASPTRGISEVAAREYAGIPGSEFPPVIIDSDRKKTVLQEGGHRTRAAVLRGDKEITAIDIAGARIVPYKWRGEVLETFAFKRKTRSPKD
jgi:hypothetical protein